VFGDGCGMCECLGLLPWELDGGKLPKGRVPLSKGIWWVQLDLEWAGLRDW